MGRQIKRVPLDFDWPIDKTWRGYLMPDSLDERTCETCGGDGYSPEARAIANTFYPHMIKWGDTAKANALAWHDKIGQAEVDNLIEQGRLLTIAHREPTEDNPRDWEWLPLPRTAADVNAEQRRGMGCHDAINRAILVEFRCERLGIPLRCENCGGYGSTEVYPGQRAEAEAWERTEPPTGKGWQVWETVSEGSPISPVFPTAEALAEWMVSGASKWAMPDEFDVALRFIQAGWAPSAVATPGRGVEDGATYVGRDA